MEIDRSYCVTEVIDGRVVIGRILIYCFIDLRFWPKAVERRRYGQDRIDDIHAVIATRPRRIAGLERPNPLRS